METKQYEAPALRIVSMQPYMESFCQSGGAPDYDPINDYEWGND